MNLTIQPSDNQQWLSNRTSRSALLHKKWDLIYLVRHDEIFMPEEGELHFFDAKWEKGIEWYKKHFTPAENEQLLGEKTPAYCYLPAMPERINSVVPEVKLVWIFRNPIERAYSNYWHSVRVGLEPLGFDDALRREEQRLEESLWYGYAKRGRYAEQLERFLKYYDHSSMFFALFEDLIEEPKSVLVDLLNFLEVDVSREITRPPVKANPSYNYHSKWIQYAARRLFGRGRLPFRVVSRLNQKSTPGYPPMSEQARSYLRDYFRPLNQRLAVLTNLDLSGWES
ncbi:hypothetical protein GGQ06_003237 [Salinibacter ruber]|nr:hypothetical protein [Salinibacter ruber]